MARIWKLGVQEVRPGTYFRTSSGDVTAVGAINGIAAILYQSNWGALNKVVNISPEELNNLHNIVGTGSGYSAVREALIGGATMVRAVRVGSGGKAVRVNLYTKAYTVLSATKKYIGVRLYAKYRGYRKFTATIQLSLNETGKKELVIYDEENRVVDRVTFTAGGNETKKLANAVNSGCTYFTARVITDKKVFATPYTTTSYCLTTATERNVYKKIKTLKKKAAAIIAAPNSTDEGDLTTEQIEAEQLAYVKGLMNPKVNTSAYSDATELLERYYWNVITASSDSSTVHEVLTTFARQSYQNGHLGMAVICGKTSTALATRIAYAKAINDWRVVYVLGGWKSNTGKSYNGYLAAARIAGMIAACETNASLTHIVVQDALELLDPLTHGQMIEAEEKGCFVLSLNDEDQVWIDNAINTLVTLGNDQDDGWKKIRRTKCRFELMTRINRTCDKLTGRLNNDENGRATLVTAMNGIIGEMIAEGKLFQGSYAAEDPRYKPVGDRAYFFLQIGDIDSMEKIYLDFNFSYANPFAEE